MVSYISPNATRCKQNKNEAKYSKMVEKKTTNINPVNGELLESKEIILKLTFLH